MLGYLLSKIICNLVGFLYPAYASYKAIKSSDAKKATLWLMYWIVLSLFTLAEGFADKFIFWFPFYYELKMFFVLWLILPQTQGAVILYNRVVDPTFTDHEKEIDAAFGITQDHAKSVGVEWGKRGLQVLQKTAVDGLLRGQTLMNDRLGTPAAAPREPPSRPPSYIDIQNFINLNNENATDNSNNSNNTNSPGFGGYLHLGRSLISRFYPAATSTSSPDTANEPSSPTIYSAHPISSVLPDDVFDAPLNEQQAYLEDQRMQLEQMLSDLDRAQREIQERAEWSSATPPSTPPPTPVRSSPDSGPGTSRRRQKKGNGSRKNMVYHEVIDDDREDGSSNSSMDEQELRRRQTQAIGLTSYLTGYFSKTNN